MFLKVMSQEKAQDSVDLLKIISLSGHKYLKVQVFAIFIAHLMFLAMKTQQMCARPE